MPTNDTDSRIAGKENGTRAGGERGEPGAIEQLPHPLPVVEPVAQLQQLVHVLVGRERR